MLIPTLVLLLKLDMQTCAGSLSLAVSLPTMLDRLSLRYSQTANFAALGENRALSLALWSAGSLVGAFVGGRLLGIDGRRAFYGRSLAAILLASAAKIWRSRWSDAETQQLSRRSSSCVRSLAMGEASLSPLSILSRIFGSSSGSGFRSRAWFHWKRASSLRPTRQ